MANLNGFDANRVEPATEFEAVPAGKYLAVVVASEMKPTKNKRGRYLELVLEIIEGECKGRKLWARLNLENENPQTVQIARGELSSICRAVGVMQPQDSVELHNLPMLVTVKCKKREDNGEITNEVKGYAKRQSIAGRPAQAEASVPPWCRN
jgi:hypothetical protein